VQATAGTPRDLWLRQVPPCLSYIGVGRFEMSRLKWGMLILVAACAVVFLAFYSCRRHRSSITFSLPEIESLDSGPAGRTRRVKFRVTNSAPRSVWLQVAAVETNGGSGWAADTNAIAAGTFETLGAVPASSAAQLTIDLRPCRGESA
jgi:uncharacterized protein (DUF58 family)